jgi:hypothetical protein
MRWSAGLPAEREPGWLEFKAPGQSRPHEVGSASGFKMPASIYHAWSYRGPLPTGSLALDLATGIGGLGRGNVVGVLGHEQEPATRLIKGFMGKTQRYGRVGVVDLGAGVTPATIRGSVANYRDLLVVRTDDAALGLTYAIELVRSAGLDLLVVNELGEAVARWFNRLAGYTRTTAEARVDELLRDLTNATRESATTVLIPRPGQPEPWPHAYYDVDLTVRPASGSEPHETIVARVVVDDDDDRSVTLYLLPDGSVEPIHDLVDSAIQTNVIAPYGLGPFEHDSLKTRLDDDVDLRLQLSGDVERHATELRSAAQGGEPQAAEPLDELDPEPEPSEDPDGRFVNTWFEGEEPVLPLPVGRPRELHLSIGPRTDPETGSSTPFDHEPAPADRVPLLVNVFGADFDIEPRWSVLLLPRAPQASDETRFSVTARRAGDLVLRIVICTLRELELLQELEIDASAVETPVEEASR